MTQIKYLNRGTITSAESSNIPYPALLVNPTQHGYKVKIYLQSGETGDNYVPLYLASGITGEFQYVAAEGISTDYVLTRKLTLSTGNEAEAEMYIPPYTRLYTQGTGTFNFSVFGIEYSAE